MKTPRDPVSAPEWQEAVNAAEFFICVDSCRQYGLLDGTPEVNIGRAIEILERGRVLGFHPAPMSELVKMFVRQGGRLPDAAGKSKSDGAS